SYVLDKSKKLLGTSDYSELFGSYGKLKKISFDYAVAETETSIEVLRYSGEWKDLGTWNTLTEAMEEPIIGDGRLNDACSNVHIINELGIPILGMGLKDVVISASPEGILVSDKKQSSYIKPFVEDIGRQIMFAEKSWGSYRVLDVEKGSLTVRVTLNPRHKMNYHSHEHRDEVWTVVSGGGKAVVDGVEQLVKPGNVVTMAAGCKHTVIAGEDGLGLIEVQLGSEISVSDKRKYEL
ncbi:MAG: cupin domain-containing protein, partial [Lachnospiraceae bacterium]|nr:cupin domain-containing protein [Lachnospiraceae bacterium]